MDLTDPGAEFAWRRAQYCRIAEHIVVDTVLNEKHTGLGKLYSMLVIHQYAEHMFTALDKC